MSFKRQLAQLRPSTTSAEVLYASSQPFVVLTILCTNSSGSAVDINIYHDADGTTYDATTEVLATYSLQDGETLEYSPEHGLSGYKTGNIAVKTSVVDSVNFTAYGEVYGELV